MDTNYYPSSRSILLFLMVDFPLLHFQDTEAAAISGASMWRGGINFWWLGRSFFLKKNHPTCVISWGEYRWIVVLLLLFGGEARLFIPQFLVHVEHESAKSRIVSTVFYGLLQVFGRNNAHLGWASSVLWETVAVIAGETPNGHHDSENEPFLLYLANQQGYLQLVSCSLFKSLPKYRRKAWRKYYVYTYSCFMIND